MSGVISALAPIEVGLANAGYHPTRTDERCVGSIWNNAADDISQFYMDGQHVMFKDHGADHEHDLSVTASTSWRNLPVNIPLSATSVSISVSSKYGATGDGMVVYGADGATGTLTSTSMDPTDNGFEDVLLHAASSSSQDANGVSVHGSIPIDDRTVPAISYGMTRNLHNDDVHILIVNGYTDLWAPK